MTDRVCRATSCALCSTSHALPFSSAPSVFFGRLWECVHSVRRRLRPHRPRPLPRPRRRRGAMTDGPASMQHLGTYATHRMGTQGLCRCLPSLPQGRSTFGMAAWARDCWHVGIQPDAGSDPIAHAPPHALADAKVRRSIHRHTARRIGQAVAYSMDTSHLKCSYSARRRLRLQRPPPRPR